LPAENAITADSIASIRSGNDRTLRTSASLSQIAMSKQCATKINKLAVEFRFRVLGDVLVVFLPANSSSRLQAYCVIISA
jgi:hypothetical protein